MRKALTLVATGVATALALTACGGSDSASSAVESLDPANPVTLTVGASPTPHARILEFVRDNLTEEQCRTMVLQILHECFVEELSKYLLAEVMVTVKAVQKLWEKYYTSATELLAQRKKAEDKLNGFLKKLGYLYE